MERLFPSNQVNWEGFEVERTVAGVIWVRDMDSAKSYAEFEMLKLHEPYLAELPLVQEQCTPVGRAVDSILVKYWAGVGDVMPVNGQLCQPQPQR